MTNFDIIKKLSYDTEITEILDRVVNNGTRDINDNINDGIDPLDPDDGKKLLKCYDLNLLGAAADALRKRSSGDLVTFVIDRNINYTNICTSKCKFCAFYREPDAKDAYVLSLSLIHISEPTRLRRISYAVFCL